MSLQGWTLPQSATGNTALVPEPPWYFSGDLLGVDFVANPAAVAELLPEPLSPPDEPRASIIFADWSSAAESDPRLAADPGKGQYREAYVALDAVLDDRKVARVPYIWVDSDLSLVRGLLQGFPKKFGDIRISRAVEVGRGGPRREPGARFGAHVSSVGRRLATASVNLDEPRDDRIPSALTRAIWHTRLFPNLAGGEPLVHDLSRNEVVDFEIANHWTGQAELEFEAADFEEVDRLAPVEVRGGWICSMAMTIAGAEVRDIG